MAEILFGKVNPSGKLPVTFERRITDNPAYATFPNPVNQHLTQIAYSEGLYVGYRGYEKRKISQALELFRVIRHWNYDLLRDLPETVFERTGTHSERGQFSLMQLTRLVAEHVEHHVQQIAATRAAYKEHRTRERNASVVG